MTNRKIDLFPCKRKTTSVSCGKSPKWRPSTAVLGATLLIIALLATVDGDESANADESENEAIGGTIETPSPTLASGANKKPITPRARGGGHPRRRFGNGPPVGGRRLGGNDVAEEEPTRSPAETPLTGGPGFLRPRRMSARHLLASHRSGNFCPFAVTKTVTCLVANGTETYQTRVAVGAGFQSMTMTRPRLVTSYKEVKETNYGCCPGFYGDNCDTTCYNCTQIQDLESRVRTLESKLLRNPSRAGGGGFSSDYFDGLEDDPANPLLKPIKMGRPDVSHVNGHPLNGKRAGPGGPFGARGPGRGPGFRGRNGRFNGGGREGVGRAGGRRRFGGAAGTTEGQAEGEAVPDDEEDELDNEIPGRSPRPGYGPPRCQCPPGRPGPPGPPGSDGRDGQPGTTSAAGGDGSGDGGARLVPGPPGKTGRPGPVGLPGPAGPQGSIGLSGQDGLPGARGLVGPLGPPGPSIPGPKGERGFDGTPGQMGPPGFPGPPGIGERGLPGESGLPGFPGLSGQVGNPGRPGPIGPVGPRGYPGDVGPGGPGGPPGPPGAPSAGYSRRRGGQLEILDLTGPDHGSGSGYTDDDDSYRRGPPGAIGPPGPAGGPHGPPGIPGPPGLPGRPGVAGQPGYPGVPGAEASVTGASLGGDNVRAAMENLFNAVSALRTNLDFLDARVTILENELPKIREMTGGGSQGGIAGYPDVPYHSGVDTITDEITAATDKLGRKVGQVTSVLQALPEDPRLSSPDQTTSPQPDADGRGRISGRQDGFAYDRRGGESGREEGTYDRRGESAHGGHGGVSRTPGHGTHPQEGSPESEPREEGSGDERNQIGLERGHEREGVEYGRQDGGHRRPDGEHGLPGGGHDQTGGGHDQTGGEHGQLGGELDQPIGGQAQPGGGHGQLGGGHSQQGGGHGQTGGGHGQTGGGHGQTGVGHGQTGGGHGQTGGGHRQHGGGHGRPGGGLEQPDAGHDQSGSGQGQLGGRYGQQGGRQGQQGGRHGQQAGGRHGQQGGGHGQTGGGLGQQGGRFGQQGGGGRFGQQGSGQSGHGQRGGRGQGVHGGGHARQGVVARDGEEHEQGSASGLPERETSTAQYERPHGSGTGQANVEGRQDGTESRVEETHGNQHGIHGRHDETLGRQDGVYGRQGGVHGRQDETGSRQGEFGDKTGGTHGRQGGAGSRIDVATGRLDGRQDPSIGRVDGAYGGGRDGLHGSSVGLPGRTGSTGAVSWGAGYGQGSQGFSQSSHSSSDISSSGRDGQSTGIPPGHSAVHTESNLGGQDFDSDSEHGSDDDDTGSGQGVDQQGLPFGNEDFPVVAEPESKIAVTGVEGFVTAAETGTPIANGTGGDYEESEYDYYYEEAEEEEEEEDDDDDDESFDDYKYYEDYNEAVRRKRQQHNVPGKRFTTLAPDVASTPREAGRLARPNAMLRNASNLESGIGSHQLSRTLRGRKRTTTATGYDMHDTTESNNVIESSENDDSSIVALRSTSTTPEPETTLLKGLPGDAGPTSRRIIRPGPPVRSGGGRGTLHVKKRPQMNTFSSNATGGGGGYPRLQTLRKLAKKWRARKEQLQRAKREAGEDLTWI